MIAEYIEREALLEDIAAAETNGGMGAVVAGTLRRYVKRQPAADVAPVRHGYWIDKPTGRYRQWQSWCSVCENRSGIGGIESNRHKPYCPNCGARMDWRN